MLANEQVILIWIVVGFTPHFVKKQWNKEGCLLEARALFWSVQVTSMQWTIRIPLIEQLRHSIWAVIIHLRENDHSKN